MVVEEVATVHLGLLHRAASVGTVDHLDRHQEGNLVEGTLVVVTSGVSRVGNILSKEEVVDRMDSNKEEVVDRMDSNKEEEVVASMASMASMGMGSTMGSTVVLATDRRILIP